MSDCCCQNSECQTFDYIGLIFTPERKRYAYSILFLFYLAQVFLFELGEKTTPKDPNYSFITSTISINVILIFVSFVAILFFCLNLHLAEKLTIIFNSIIVSLQIGWLILSFLGQQSRVFLGIDFFICICFIISDFTNQRLQNTLIGKQFSIFTFAASMCPTLFSDGSSFKTSSSANKYGNLSKIQNSTALEDLEMVETGQVGLEIPEDDDFNRSHHEHSESESNLRGPSSAKLSRSNSTSSQASTSTTSLDTPTRAASPTHSSKLTLTPPTAVRSTSAHTALSPHPKGYGFGHHKFVQKFRLDLPSLPPGMPESETNVSWSTLSEMQHRIDSSSCHIYTAIWQERPVIVKLIKADRVNSDLALSEFEMEANVLSRVNHPNIIKMLGGGSIPPSQHCPKSRRFLVLELLDGGSLSHTMGLRPDANKRVTKRTFSFLQGLRMGRDMAHALEYLHHGWDPAVHIIHRDLKPDNVGWTSHGELKIFDFGLCATVKATSHQRDAFKMTGNTGTLRYMAPEVVQNKGYNHSVDTYSFAILFWQILSDQVPFKSMGKTQFTNEVVLGGVRPELDPRWPPRLHHLLSACWHPDMGARPSFTIVVRELNELIREAEQARYCGCCTQLQMEGCGAWMGGCFQWLLWTRPIIFLLSLLLFLFSCIVFANPDYATRTGLLQASASDPSHADSGQDDLHYRDPFVSAMVSGAMLMMCGVFGLYLISLSYLRGGAARRKGLGHSHVVGLEMGHNSSTSPKRRNKRSGSGSSSPTRSGKASPTGVVAGKSIFNPLPHEEPRALYGVTTTTTSAL